MPDAVQPELLPDARDREQRALDDAYDELAAMRSRAAALLADVRAAGKPDPDLEMALVRRVALLGDSARPLCFGRIDRDDGTTWYLGRRHVEDEASDPVVIEWRVPMAAAFYQANPADPHGLRRRRQFLLDGRRLLSYADDVFGGAGDAGDGAIDGIGSGPRLRGGDALLAELERARTGEMTDIVATIQTEQDAVIRAPLRGVVAVQGGPGTGKTAIGLHRAAYLLYSHPELADTGVLVVGPSRTFLRYIAQVLPSLGEEAVVHVAVGDLVPGASPTATDPTPVARLKGDARMAAVVERALAALRRPVTEDLALDIGLSRIRIPGAEVDRLAAALAASGGPYKAGRAALRARLVSEVYRAAIRAGHQTLDRARVSQEAGASASFKAMLDRAWPAVSPKALVADLLGSPARIAEAGAGVLDDGELDLLSAAARGRPRGKWSAGDLALVDEAQALIHGRGRAYGHVVVDEAQDLTPMQLRMIARRCPAGSATVLGDLAQATGPIPPASWDDVLAYLPRPDGATSAELTLGYRAPAAVLDYASRLLPYTTPGIRRTVSVRPSRHPLVVRRVPAGDLDRTAAELAAALAGEGFLVGCIATRGAVAGLASALARIGAPYGVAERDGLTRQITLLPAEGAKGLEFDAVVVVEPAAIAAGDGGLRQLYVALSRPVQQLTVVHSDPLPPALADADV
jgi:DNA helicase IV